LPIEASELKDIYEKFSKGDYHNFTEIPISSNNIVNLNIKNWKEIVHDSKTYSVVFFT